MPDEANVHYVVFHSPGPKWVVGIDFREQPGVEDHVNHYRRWLDEGKLQMGGPYLPPHNGGMMITAHGVSPEEVETYAASDPAVIGGLLIFEVKAWYTPLWSI